MGKTVLLVGPSGVGKTTVCSTIGATFPQCLFEHLDGLASKYAHRMDWIDHPCVTLLRKHVGQDDHFLAIGLQAIADLSDPLLAILPPSILAKHFQHPKREERPYVAPSASQFFVHVVHAAPKPAL